MTEKKWPSFVTWDLGDSPEDDAEMTRRWQAYDREMKALIAAGGVHQDDDGWWVETATGELIGPDPEIERPLMSEELERALARPDAEQMCQQLDAYAAYHASGAGDWPDESADAFEEIISCYYDDPEKALAHVILGASRSDHPAFLRALACGPLEDVLRAPSEDLLERIVAEARTSARFRWLLSHPFKVAVAAKAWEAIEKFRITGPHEEPPADKLPSRG